MLQKLSRRYKQASSKLISAVRQSIRAKILYGLNVIFIYGVHIKVSDLRSSSSNIRREGCVCACVRVGDRGKGARCVKEV